ncbi:efflux RND transporter periplasmic adaptor subunit [bacterium]|nr:efflux RND transporter periplasmic adaptor subunit [candidate division CSSED10-310 bacterium]
MTERTGNGQFDLSDLTIETKAKTRPGSTFLPIVIFMVILCLVGSLVYYFAFYNAPVLVQTAMARTRDPGSNSIVLSASGYVTPRQRATIASKITGRIIALHVEEGLHVETGQLLAELDDSDARIYHRSAEADLHVAEAAIPELRVQLRDAERNLERDTKLAGDQMISRQALEASETIVDSLRARIVLAQKQVLAAKARLDQAVRNLDDYRITAPFAGIVVSKDAQVGEMVSPVSGGGGYTRTGVATIVDMDSLEIEVDVNESYIARVKPGQRVEAVLDAYPEWKIPCRVLTIIPTADRQKATVSVRIAFEQLDPKILPDMGVKVSFLDMEKPGQDRELTAPAVVIPQEAVLRAAGKATVFVVRNGTVEARAVRLGGTSGNDVEIIAGVTSGEELAVGNISGLKDGAKVRRSAE